MRDSGWGPLMRRPSLSVDHSWPTCARQNSCPSSKVSTRDLHVSATAFKKRSPAGDRRYLRRRDTSALNSRKSLGPENADNMPSFVRVNCKLADGQPECSQPNARFLNRLLNASSLHLAEPRCVWQMRQLPPLHTNEKSRPLAAHYQGKFRPEYRGSGSTNFGNCRLTSSASLSRSTST